MAIIDTYLVFDFETTGLDPANDRIIQVGLCEVAGGKAVSQRSWLVRQEVPIHPEAQARHGITAQQLREHGIAPAESLAQLVKALRAAPALVGHNVHRFDIPFFLAECRRFKVTPPDCAGIIDTAALFKGRKLRLSRDPSETHRAYANRVLSVRVRGLSYSVEHCIADLRIQTKDLALHDASNDAYVTHLIFQALQQLR